jgi:hypothetical protein
VNIGVFSPDQKEAILRERPNVKFITLESVDPLRITLSSRDGPTVDLTPLIPAELVAWAGGEWFLTALRNNASNLQKVVASRLHPV